MRVDFTRCSPRQADRAPSARRRALAGAGLFALALGPWGSARAQAKLKWAHTREVGDPYHASALWAAAEIRKRTGGRYEMEVIPGGSAGTEAEIQRQLALGTVDIAGTGQVLAGQVYGPMAIGGAPYMFRDYGHWQKYAASPLFAELAEHYRQRSGGHKVSALAYLGIRHVTSNREIARPGDMRGLQIRVPDGPLERMFPRAVGARPVHLALAESYLALQRGELDAFSGPLALIEARRFYEVQKYIVLTGHITDAILTLVGRPLWGRLSRGDKAVFLSVFQEAAARASGEAIQNERRIGADFERRGSIVMHPDLGPFRASVQRLHNSPGVTWPAVIYDRLQAL